MTLYADLNYAGSSMTMSGDIAALSGVNFNDAATSLLVSAGTRLAAYALPNYGGICEEFTAGDGDRRNNPSGNDRISSVQPGKPPRQAETFTGVVGTRFPTAVGAAV